MAGFKLREDCTEAEAAWELYCEEYNSLEWPVHWDELPPSVQQIFLDRVKVARYKPEERSYSLAEAFPVQQARARGVMREYQSFPEGAIGAILIEAALQRADRAAVSQDVVAMLRSYEELKEIN